MISRLQICTNSQVVGTLMKAVTLEVKSKYQTEYYKRQCTVKKKKKVFDANL